MNLSVYRRDLSRCAHNHHRPPPPRRVTQQQAAGVADNVAIINATDLSPVLENTQTKTHKERVNTSGHEGGAATTEVKLTVAQLPSTTGIETMIQSGQVGRRRWAPRWGGGRSWGAVGGCGLVCVAYAIPDLTC